jgi:hypothetical protein
MNQGLHGSFQCVFIRGLVQMFTSYIIVYKYRLSDVALFGNTSKVQLIMFLRSVVGYGGIAFSFLSVERLPLGDATVLTMLRMTSSVVMTPLALTPTATASGWKLVRRMSPATPAAWKLP